MPFQRSTASPSTQGSSVHSDRRKHALTIQDVMALIAGFVVGFVLHQVSSFRDSVWYRFPVGGGRFHSLLGLRPMAWPWALVVGFVFVIVGRCFRCGGRIRAAEWLAVWLGIMLLDSAITVYRPAPQEYPEPVFVRAGSPQTATSVVYELRSEYTAAHREYLKAFAFEMTAAVLVAGLGGWVLRKRLGPGWLAILAIVLAALAVLGPAAARSTVDGIHRCTSAAISSQVFRLSRHNATQDRPVALRRRQCLARLFPACLPALGGGHPRGTRSIEAAPRLVLDRGIIGDCGAELGRLLAERRVRLAPRRRSWGARHRSVHVVDRSRRSHRGIDPRLEFAQTARSATSGEELTVKRSRNGTKSVRESRYQAGASESGGDALSRSERRLWHVDAAGTHFRGAKDGFRLGTRAHAGARAYGEAPHHHARLAHRNSIIFTVIVRHQKSGQRRPMAWRAERRNSSPPMIATLVSTFAAESQSGARGRHRLAIAAGRSAREPIRQIRPRSPQYRRRFKGGSNKPDAPNCTTHVKHGTTIPTAMTSGKPACTVKREVSPRRSP